MWKEIEGFENYSVNELGEIKNNKTSRLLKQSKKRGGYNQVSLSKTKKHTKTVHRLVISAFISNDLNKPEINHKNGIKTDNRLENLEWCSRSENQLHSYRFLGKIAGMVGRRGNKHPRSMPVNQLSIDGKLLNRFNGIMEAERETGINGSSIHQVLNRKRKTAGGCKWEFCNNCKDREE